MNSLSGKQEDDENLSDDENEVVEDNMLQEDEVEEEEIQTPASRCKDRMSKLMISPDNKRLKNIHLVVSFTYFLDLIVTSLMLGNYRF